jgi:hypothetical protein
MQRHYCVMVTAQPTSLDIDIAYRAYESAYVTVETTYIAAPNAPSHFGDGESYDGDGTGSGCGSSNRDQRGHIIN